MNTAPKTVNMLTAGFVGALTIGGAALEEFYPSFIMKAVRSRPLTPPEEHVLACARDQLGASPDSAAADVVTVLALDEYSPSVDQQLFHSPMLVGSSLLTLCGNAVWRRYAQDEQIWLLSLNLSHLALGHGRMMYAWMAASFAVPYALLFAVSPHSVLVSLVSLAVHLIAVNLVEKHQFKEAAMHVFKNAGKADSAAYAMVNVGTALRQIEREREVVGSSPFNTPTIRAREKILAKM